MPNFSSGKTAQSKTQFHKIPTVGNGNCLFNAVAQDICYRWADGQTLLGFEQKLSTYLSNQVNVNNLSYRLRIDANSDRFTSTRTQLLLSTIDPLFKLSQQKRVAEFKNSIIKIIKKSAAKKTDTLKFIEVALGHILRDLTKTAGTEIAELKINTNGKWEYADISCIPHLEQIVGCSIGVLHAANKSQVYYVNGETPKTNISDKVLLIAYEACEHFSTVKTTKINVIESNNAIIQLKNQMDIAEQAFQQAKSKKKSAKLVNLLADEFLNHYENYYSAIVAHNTNAVKKELAELSKKPAEDYLNTSKMQRLEAILMEHVASLDSNHLPTSRTVLTKIEDTGFDTASDDDSDDTDRESVSDGGCFDLNTRESFYGLTSINTSKSNPAKKRSNSTSSINSNSSVNSNHSTKSFSTVEELTTRATEFENSQKTKSKSDSVHLLDSYATIFNSCKTEYAKHKNESDEQKTQWIDQQLDYDRTNNDAKLAATEQVKEILKAM